MFGLGEGLAVVAVLIAVTENYRKAFKDPITRFRKFPKAVNRYLTRLQNQAVQFEAHCENLLGTVRNEDQVHQILACSGDVSWQDEEIESDIVALLGKRGQAYLSTLLEIDSILKENSQESDKLIRALEREKEVRWSTPVIC